MIHFIFCYAYKLYLMMQAANNHRCTGYIAELFTTTTDYDRLPAIATPFLKLD